MVQNKKRFVFVGCGKIAYCHADVILSLGHQIIGVAARTKSPTIGLFSEKYRVPKSAKIVSKRWAFVYKTHMLVLGL